MAKRPVTKTVKKPTAKVPVKKGATVKKEVPVTVNDPEVKSGEMSTFSHKTPPQGYVTVGLSKGVTINMGNYQTARVDCFIIRNVPDSDEHIESCFTDINEKLTAEIESVTEQLEEWMDD